MKIFVLSKCQNLSTNISKQTLNAEIQLFNCLIWQIQNRIATLTFAEPHSMKDSSLFLAKTKSSYHLILKYA